MLPEKELTVKRALIQFKDTDVFYDTVRANGILEITCVHGVGHPVGHRRGWLDTRNHEGIHACDQCCLTYKIQRGG